jgi:hypothetical protein
MEDEKQTVNINPQNEGVKQVLNSIVGSFPEMEEADDQEMAQFLADLLVATSIMVKEGGDMHLEDVVSVVTMTYKILDGFGGVEQ